MLEPVDVVAHRVVAARLRAAALAPRMRGDEFYLLARELRASLADRFIFITGFATDPHITSFFSRHELKYLVKPFPIEGLINCIKELFS